MAKSFQIQVLALLLSSTPHGFLAHREPAIREWVPPTIGQSSIPDSAVVGVITGTVFDPSGAVIADAKISLVEGGVTKFSVATDASGGFRFVKLAPGTYTLKIQAEGFADAERKIRLTDRVSAPLSIVLSVAGQSQSVSVTSNASDAAVSTETSENQNSNTVNRAALDRVPVFDQDYITTLSRFLDDSATGTNGVSLVVNGVEANGPGVTPSAVQEVKINEDPYSPLFSRPGRARLEVVTKGGTSDFHGAINFLYRNAVFDASNAFAAKKPAEQRQYYEGSLTGPLGPGKKTTFLLSLDDDLDDQQAVVSAEGLTGPINENVPAPMHHFFGSGRIFHDLANNDQLWLGYSYERQVFKEQGVGGLVLPEAGYNTNFQEHEINFSYRHLLSPSLVNQLRFLVGHFDRPITSINENPQVVVSGAFTGGGAQADSRRTEYHFDGVDMFIYARGKQTLTFGVDVPDISRRGEDDFTNMAGTYTFGSLNDYQLQTPSTFLLQRGQGHLVFTEVTLAGFIEDQIRLNPNVSISLGMRYYWQNYFHDDPNNLAPRFGFAYAPGQNGKTVFRGGAGVFYDRSGPRPIADLLHFNGVNLLRFILDNPPYPVMPPDLTGVPTSVVVLDPHARIPYTIQYSVGVERQVTAKSTFSAVYVGSRGIDLFRSLDANAPRNLAPPNLPPVYGPRPDASLGQERTIQSDGYQKTNAMELTFRGKPTTFLTGQVQYTLSKAYNNTSGITFFPGNSYDPAADWARSDNDRRHKFDLLGSARASHFFTTGVALSLYSGKPVNITTGSDNNGDGVLNDRPVGVPRNTLHGPGLINLDLNVAHDFVFSKLPDHTRTLTVSLNSFNVLNHPNDVTYIGVITSPFFGHATSALPPRRIQLNLEYKF